MSAPLRSHTNTTIIRRRKKPVASQLLARSLAEKRTDCIHASSTRSEGTRQTSNRLKNRKGQMPQLVEETKRRKTTQK
jgi:hypothetical protein